MLAYRAIPPSPSHASLYYRGRKPGWWGSGDISSELEVKYREDPLLAPGKVVAAAW